MKSDGVEIVEVSYEAAQEEIAKNSGVNMKKSSQSNFGDVGRWVGGRLIDGWGNEAKYKKKSGGLLDFENL